MPQLIRTASAVIVVGFLAIIAEWISIPTRNPSLADPQRRPQSNKGLLFVQRVSQGQGKDDQFPTG